MTSMVITDADIDQISSSMGLTFDDEHKRILKALDSIDVQACPGSGKTTLVAAKLIILSQKLDFNKDAICVLSHTNVAKDEIIKRIEQSNNEKALKLLAYPNFIGTIHEFVNKFLGVPYLRSLDRQIKIIDDDITANKIQQLIQKPILNEIDSSDRECYNFKISNVTGKDEYKAKFPKQSASSSLKPEDFKKELETAKNKVLNDGYYFHDEMFVFANAYLDQNQSLIKMLTDRFKYIFLDEMQDTSKAQEDLIERFFNKPNNVIQRFGDVDQTLFDGMSELNKGYNGQQNWFSKINISNRFNSQIANVAKILSFSGIDLSSRDNTNDIKPCLIIFQSPNNVLLEFTKLVKSEVVEKKHIELPIVKAIAWVKKENGIKKYFAEFSPEHDKRKYTPKKFITSLWLVRQMIRDGCDLSIPYQYIINSIVRVVKFVNDEVYNTESLFTSIEKINKRNEFKKCIFDIFSQIESITEDSYNEIISNILDRLSIDASLCDNEEFIEYISYHDYMNVTTTNQKVIDGITINFSTIHGAKGETHDATLILESSFRGHYDIKLMLPWLLVQKVDRSNLAKELGKGYSASTQHMRQLYVAMTRPKHLLCLAISKHNISDDQIQSFKDQGWNIKQC